MISNPLSRDEEIQNILELIKKNEFIQTEKKLLKLSEKEKYINQAIIYNLIGFVYQKQKKIKLSEESFETALKLDKNFYPALYNLGVLHYKNSSFDKAIKFSQDFDFILRSKKKIYETVYLDGLFSSEKFVKSFLLLVKNLIKSN